MSIGSTFSSEARAPHTKYASKEVGRKDGLMDALGLTFECERQQMLVGARNTAGATRIRML